MLSLLSGPLSSIVLCILAGIALRYAVWYGRDEQRSGEPTADQQDRLRELTEKLSTEQHAQQTLRADYDQLCRQFEDFRQTSLNDRAETIENLKQALAEREQAAAGLQEQLENQVADSRKQLAALNQQLSASQTSAGHHAQLTDKLTQLAVERDGLQEHLMEQEQRLDQLQSRLDEAHSAHETSIDELLRALEHSQSENVDLQRQCDQLTSQLDSEAAEKSKVTEQMVTLSADARFVGELRSQISGLQAALKRRNDDLQLTLKQRDSFAEQLDTTKRRIDDAEDSLTTTNRESLRLHKLLAAKETEVEQIIDERTTLATELMNAQTAQDSTTSELQAALDREQSRAANLERELATSQQERSQLASENATLVKEVATSRQRANQQLTELQAKLQAAETETKRRLDDAHHQFTSQLAKRQAEWQSDIKNRAAEVADRQRAFAAELARRSDQIRSETDGRICELEEQRQQLQAQLRDTQTEKEEVLHGLHREQDLRNQTETRLAETVAGKESAEAENQALQARLNQLERRLGMAEEQLEQSEQRVTERNTAWQELRIQQKEQTHQLERERKEKATLERSLELQTQSLDKLRADSQALEDLLARQAALQSSLQQQAQLLKSGHEVRRLQETRPQVLASSASDDLFPVAPAPVAPDSVTEPSPPEEISASQADAGMTRFDPILGSVFATAPSEPDNLQMINGIDDLMEEKLNRLGVYTFDQIMQWDQRAVDEFSSILALKDRIERQQWVTQARNLKFARQARRAA